MDLKEISPDNFSINPFIKLKDEWALLSAGNTEKSNTMTVSWGGLGVIWGKHVVTIYVRPTRYTYEFCENSDYFSLSFPGKESKKDMGVLGSLSGRDCDKIAKTKLSMCFYDETPYIEQSELVFICKKLYYSDLEPEHFYDTDIENNYPKKDYHRIYIGEIIKILGR